MEEKSMEVTNMEIKNEEEREVTNKKWEYMSIPYDEDDVSPMTCPESIEDSETGVVRSFG